MKNEKEKTRNIEVDNVNKNKETVVREESEYRGSKT